jgi:N-carbamoyl-L-amino-acid hydrolase
MRFGIGQPVTRSEDPRFLTGRGRYVADIELPHQAHAAFIYSPHAHADIVSIDTTEASAAPGVLAVLTGRDWVADGLGTIDPEMMPEDMGGPKGHRTRRLPLAAGRIRYVGERVAVAIATTAAQARDAADRIKIEYRALPAVVRAPDAVGDGAPLVHEGAARNTSFTILRTLDRAGLPTTRAIEVVNWTNEEGARFQPSMLCSLGFSHQQSVEWIYDRRDKEGIRFEDALVKIGYRGEAPVGGRAIDSYFELHIEQGPMLDAAGVPLGIVTGGYEMLGMRISVRGETSHVGPTPMRLRRNALVGASYLAVAVDEIGWRFAAEDGKTTVARIDVAPNLPGIISDEAELYIDFRHSSGARLADMEREVKAAIAESGRRSRTDIKLEQRWGFGGLDFDPGLIALVRETAARLGVPSMDIRSQAGHDAYHMAKVCPTTTVFTPCRGGISHNEKEDIDLAMTVPGVNVLLHAVLARAMTRASA